MTSFNLADGNRVLGWRYITLQIADIDTVHNDLRSKGVREGLAPVTLGNVARISMILDPDGNWIELSRRASIVGSLSGITQWDKAAARFAELTNSEDYLWNPRVKRQSKPSEQEGEECRRQHRALMAALEAVRDAKNQGPEQQRIAAKALEDAQNEIRKPYSPATSRGQLP